MNESLNEVVTAGEKLARARSESQSMKNVAPVTWSFDTVRYPWVGLTFWSVLAYVCALEYPVFDTYIWYSDEVAAPPMTAKPAELVKVVKSINGATDAFTMRTLASPTPALVASTTCMESVPPPVEDSMLGGTKFEIRSIDFERPFRE